MTIAEMSVLTSELRADPAKRMMLFSGRANRALAGRIADRLGVALGQVTTKTFANGEVYCRYEESVRGADVFIVQPIIGTYGTLRAAADAVKDAGASRVYAAATHGLFSGNAYENLIASGFEQVVVTDTVPPPPGAPDFVRVLSVADLLTSSIRQIFTDGSVSDVFGGENQLF